MPRRNKRKIISRYKDMETIISMESKKPMPIFDTQPLESPGRLFSPLLENFEEILSPDIMQIAKEISLDPVMSPTRLSGSFFDAPLTTHENKCTSQKRPISRSPSPSLKAYSEVQTIDIETLADLGMTNFKKNDKEDLTLSVGSKKRSNIPATVTSGIASKAILNPDPLPMYSPRDFMSPERPNRLFSPVSPQIELEEAIRSELHKDLIKSIHVIDQDTAPKDSIRLYNRSYNVDVNSGNKLKDIFKSIYNSALLPYENYKEACSLRSNCELLKETKRKMNICQLLIREADIIIEKSTNQGLAIEFHKEYTDIKQHIRSHIEIKAYLEQKILLLKNNLDYDAIGEKYNTKETDEYHEAKLIKWRESHRNKMAKETDEQRNLRLMKERARRQKIRDNETNEQRNLRLMKERARHQKIRDNETNEHRKARLIKKREQQNNKIANETAEQREIRLNRKRKYKK